MNKIEWRSLAAAFVAMSMFVCAIESALLNNAQPLSARQLP